MEILDKNKKLEKAKKRVEQLKKFYKHVAFYVVINAFFICRRIYKDISYGDSIFEAFTDLSNYRLFFWWTVILILHGLKTYRFDFLFSKGWEERKIKEEVNKQNNL
jgi:hypothetical protein